MKHQPFETWILLEQKLTPEQKQALRNHLKTCAHCRHLDQSMREITQLFKTTPAPYPAPGFTTRWKKRLADRERKKKNVLTWTTISALTLTILVTMAMFITQIVPLSNHFPQLLIAIISQATYLVNFIASLQNLFSPLFRIGIKLIPTTWLFAFSVSLSGITAAWFVMLSKSSIFFNNMEIDK